SSNGPGAEPARALDAALARALNEGDLDLGDLRRAADLRRNPALASGNGADAARRAAEGAFDLAAGLVGQSLWRLESPAIRLADLERVVDLALTSGEPTRLERVRAFLAGLPPLPEAPPDGPAPLPAAPSDEA